MLTGNRIKTIFTLTLVLWLWVGLASAFAGTITGTVSNNSSEADSRVYLKVMSDQGWNTIFGTSIAAPGAYTIRHDLPDGNYQAMAILDIVGEGVAVSSMPAGMSTPFAVSGGIASGVTIQLNDPSPSDLVPAAPDFVAAIPGDGGLFVFWEGARNMNDFVQSESYNIYVKQGSAPVVGVDSPVLSNLAENDMDFALLTGLANGNSYYVGVTGVTGASESAITLSMGGAPVVPVASTGAANIVSGTVNISGPTLTGPLYVVLMDDFNEQVAWVKVDSPTSATAYSVSDLADGSYFVMPFVDQDNNGYFSSGDLANLDYGPVAMVSGGNLSGVDVSVDNSGAYTLVGTGHQIYDNGGPDTYNLSFTIDRNFKLPVSVAVTSGLSETVDLGVSSSGGFSAWRQNGTTRPAVPALYDFFVTYADGSSETLQGATTAVLDSPAVSLGPIDLVAGATSPTFRWVGPETAEATPPYFYDLYMHDGQGFDWQAWDMPSDQLSYDYTGQPLVTDTPYSWQITLFDNNDNQISYVTEFTPVATNTVTISGSTTDAAGVLAGVTVSEVGNPGNTTITDAGGLFSLQIDQGSVFALEFSKTGYPVLQTRFMVAGSSFDSGSWYLFSDADFASMNTGAGTGIIRSRVKEDSTGASLSGATVSALSSLNPGTAYTVQYWNGTNWGGTMTNASGKFRVKNVADGDIVIATATLAGYTFDDFYFQLYAGQMAEGSIRGTVQPTTGINGTIINGSQSPDDRVFISVLDDTGERTIFGTSIPAPGSFQIDHQLPDGQYSIYAYMNHPGVASMPTSSMPWAVSAVPFTITNGFVSGVALTLADAATINPQSLNPGTPEIVMVQPGDGQALVAFEPAVDMYGFIRSDSYSIYWKANGPPGTTPGSYDGMISGVTNEIGEYFVMIPGLSNGTTYHFIMTGTILGTESAAGVSMSATPAAPAGLSTVSGTVNLSNITDNLTGVPIYVMLVELPYGSNFYFTRIPDASVSTSFSLAGVPDGSYHPVAFVDLDSSGTMDLGEYNNLGGADWVPYITVSGSNVATTLEVGDQRAFVRIGTSQAAANGGALYGYQLDYAVSAVSKFPTHVEVTGGPYAPMDLLSHDRYGMDHDLWVDMAAPSVGVTHTYEVNYSDGTTEIFTPQTTALYTDSPVLLGPEGDAPGATLPNFSWTPAALPASTGTVNFELFDGAGFEWIVEDFPGTTTSYQYDGPPLEVGTAYTWGVCQRDLDENDTCVLTTFTPSAPILPLTVSSPNGGEIYEVGDTAIITWQEQTGADHYTVRLTTNGGSSYSTIGTGVTGNSVQWTVDDLSSTNAVIRVIAYDAGNGWLAADDSDAPFTIAQPMAVTSPNGGETLAAGSSANLTWQAQAGADHYTVRLSINGGQSFWNLATGVTNASYAWTVDNISTSNAIIRVVAYDAGNSWLATDDSDAPFSIVKYGTVLSPNGGEVLSGGSQALIDWVDFPGATKYKVRISTDGGAKFWTLQDNITTSQVTLTLPNMNSDQVLIKVVGYNAGGGWLFTDNSDAVFRIAKGGTLLTPNGGGVYQPGETLQMTWTAHPQADHYVVRFSINGGTSFWTLNANVTTNSFDWVLPNWMNSEQCKVLIQTFNSGGGWIAADQSDAAFSVGTVPPDGGGGDPGGGGPIL